MRRCDKYLQMPTQTRQQLRKPNRRLPSLPQRGENAQPPNSPVTDAAGRDTTSPIALRQRCTWLQWGTMENRAEPGELEEVCQHHDTQGGVLEVWVPGASVNAGARG